jgi:hypothetical protein
MSRMKFFELIIIALVLAAVLLAWTHYETLTNILLPIFQSISNGLTFKTVA